MAEWDDLRDEAQRMPFSKARTATLLQAIDRADAAVAEDAAFDLRIETAWAADRSGEPLVGLAAFAWCRAKLDADPERFAPFEHQVNWCHKWMPPQATAFPTVPLRRITEMIEDLERRHVAAGGGRRQAITLRMRLALQTGVGAPLADLLADWRSSARTSLTDCPACEANDEAAALVGLGRTAEAVALLSPYVRGEAPFCGDGASWLCAQAVEPLIASGRPEEARQAFVRSVREVEGDPARVEATMQLASLQARTGAPDVALTLLRNNIGHLGVAAAPADHLAAASWAAVALDRLPGDRTLDLDLAAPSSLVAFLGIDDPLEIATAAGLHRQLVVRAEELARAFDARNGTSWVSDRLAERLALEDLAGASLDPGRAQPAAPAAGSVAASPPAHPAPVETEPDDTVGDVALPTDPAALDEWCRARFDGWDPSGATADALRVWAEPSSPVELRAVAAVWLAGSEAVAPAELLAVADEPGLGPLLRARILVAVARDLPGEDPAEAGRLIDRARAAIDGVDVDADARVLVTANAARILWESGSPDAAGLLASIDDLVGGDVSARARVQAAGLRLDLASADPNRPVDGLDELAEVVIGLSEPELPVPWAVHWAQRGAGMLADVGRLDDAAATLARTLTATDRQPAALPLRYQGFLTLADVQSARGDLDAALRAQRGAIEEIRALGPTPMLGWARRGLAFQLSRMGRLDEASTQFAEAATLLLDGGDLANGLRMGLERARVELDLDEPDRARRLADAVLDRLGEVGTEEQRELRTVGFEIAGQGAGRSGEHAVAARRFSALAEELNDPDDVPAAAWSMAALAHAQDGDPDGAEQAFERALASCEDGRTPEWARSLVEGRQARVSWWRDANDEAAELARRAADRALDFGDPRLAVEHLLLLAAVHEEEERYEAMEAVLQEALVPLDDPELAHLAPEVHGRLAGALEALGRVDEAAAHVSLATGDLPT